MFFYSRKKLSEKVFNYPEKDNTLTALTLLIAESNSKEKDVIIDLVMNFFNN